MTDQEITKRHVVMRSIVAAPEGGTHELEAHDYVRPDFLDEYVADARQRWQVVKVEDEPDAGELGYDGPTFVPGHLDHPLAGQYFPATAGSEVEKQLLKAGDPVATAAAAATFDGDSVHISTLQEG